MNEDYISKIGIIGLGNIGQRHLESLMQSSSKLDIYLYDLDINKVLDSIKKIILRIRLSDYFISKI